MHNTLLGKGDTAGMNDAFHTFFNDYEKKSRRERTARQKRK
jgi:hypothetical protein